jgi:hypothetical protein
MRWRCPNRPSACAAPWCAAEEPFEGVHALRPARGGDDAGACRSIVDVVRLALHGEFLAAARGRQRVQRESAVGHEVLVLG